MENLEIALGITVFILLVLYIREKIKPKTEAEIQYQRDKDEAEKLLRMENAERLKTLDQKIKALKTPVVYISAFSTTTDFSPMTDGKRGMTFQDSAYNEVILSVKDGNGVIETFQINSKWRDVRNEAPFVACLLEDKIFNNADKKKEEVLF